MRVEFLRNYDWSPKEYGGRVTLAFTPGVRVVTRICAHEAIAAGAAVAVKNGDENDEPSSGRTD